MTGGFTSNDNASIELVVVFRKRVSVDRAIRVMDLCGHPYRKGRDSSRGRIYASKTGPAFVATVDARAEPEFIRRVGRRFSVYEVYRADWSKCKD